MNTTATRTINIGDLVYAEDNYVTHRSAGVVVGFYPSAEDRQVTIFELIPWPGTYAATNDPAPLNEHNIREAFGDDELIDAEPFFNGIEAHRYAGTLSPEQCDRLHEMYINM